MEVEQQQNGIKSLGSNWVSRYGLCRLEDNIFDYIYEPNFGDIITKNSFYRCSNLNETIIQWKDKLKE